MEPQPSSSSAYAVRAAEAGDLPSIADIYNDMVLSSTATFDTEPWTAGRREEWFREHSHPYVLLVAIHGGELVGWASLSRFQRKPAYRLTAEDSVYVRADDQGRGIAALLLARLLGEAAKNGFHSVVAGIVGDNPASLRLHRRLGFRRAGVEREVGHKLGRWLDVVVMQKILAG